MVCHGSVKFSTVNHPFNCCWWRSLFWEESWWRLLVSNIPGVSPIESKCISVSVYVSIMRSYIVNICDEDAFSGSFHPFWYNKEASVYSNCVYCPVVDILLLQNLLLQALQYFTFTFATKALCSLRRAAVSTLKDGVKEQIWIMDKPDSGIWANKEASLILRLGDRLHGDKLAERLPTWVKSLSRSSDSKVCACGLEKGGRGQHCPAGARGNNCMLFSAQSNDLQDPRDVVNGWLNLTVPKLKGSGGGWEEMKEWFIATEWYLVALHQPDTQQG